MKIYHIAAALSFYALASYSYAQGLGQSSTAETLDTLVVTNETNRATGSLTSPTVKEAREKLKKYLAALVL